MKKKLCKVIAITYFLLLVSSSAVFASTEAIYTAGSNLAADLFLGSTGDEVLAVQQRLTALGYDPGSPDGYFGSVTEAAVKEFQAANGLYVDGVVGSVTYNALYCDAAFSQPFFPAEPAQPAQLSLGSHGEEVLAIQMQLLTLGYDPGTLDGYFGTVTEAAVKEFQAANGLYVDGVVGSVTYNALFGHLNPEVGAVENSNTTFTFHQDGWYVARLEVEVWDKEKQDYIWIYSDSCANGWHYYDQNGTKLKNQWLFDNGNWYYLDGKGVMATGWLLDNGKYYFLDETSGLMKTGWLYKDGSWYFLDYWTGARHTGWVWDNNSWYYIYPSGVMATGWIVDNNTWYYMYPSGSMATGWVYTDDAWYYFRADGSMATGDVIIGDTWYSFDENGIWIE